jgi:hypothetical protein
MRFHRFPLALLLSAPPLFLALALSSWAEAADKPAPPPSSGAPATLTLAEVNDRRSESFARVALSFVAPDLKASEVRGQRIVVKEAVDDTGTNLVPDNAAEATFELNYGALSFRSQKEPAQFRVELKSPSRAATSLKLVSGHVELYVPGRDPASSVTVAKYLSTDGRPLSDPALSANGVEVTVLGPKGIAAERKAAGEKARKEAREAGRDPADVEELGASEEKNYLSNYDPKYHTVLKVKDPNDRIGAYAHVSPQGKEDPASSSLFSGYVFLTHAPELGPDWGLRIQLKTPKSMLVRPIALKDVPLP